jgi:thiol-disulfide isomerase/thioredoxin
MASRRRASAAAKVLQRSLLRSSAKLWDIAALVVIALALWKVFIAPRALGVAGSAQPAPHATFARVGGGTFRISDARGKVLFLDFYASWCEPCKLELPLVRRWANAHARAVVVPVDVAEPRAAVATFARAHDLGDVALDPHGDAQGIFSIVGLPTVVVIDPQGRIRARWEGLNPAIALAMSHAQATLSNDSY